MKEYTAENISDFLDIIAKIKKEWDADDLWFRGVSNVKYKLLPSLYRGNYKLDLEEEGEVYTQFVRKAKAFIFDYHKLKAIDWYILMQHYSFPTRLLDWTSGSLIALYFAVKNIQEETDRCIYVIDPFEVNKAFHNIEAVFCSDENFQKPYEVINSYLPKKQLPKYPIAFEPPYFDKRIVAQKSCFTIHGEIREPFEMLFSEKKVKLAKIKIADQDVIEIKEELASAGITESIVFPDIEGLSRELIFHYVIE